MGIGRDLVFAARKLRLRLERRRLDYPAEEAARASRLAEVLPATEAQLRSYEAEYDGRSEFHRRYSARVDALHEADVLTDTTHWRDGKTLYVVCRAVEPRVVVETGVRYGSFDAHILAALARTGRGELHALDLPGGPPGPFEYGHLIPNDLRDRWTLHAGDARTVLPDLLAELGPVDVFLHDSDHRRPHMRFEFETAMGHLADDGVLASHDVRLSPEFGAFCRSEGLRSCVVADTGIARAARPSDR